jgi:hypothetical protein
MRETGRRGVGSGGSVVLCHRGWARIVMDFRATETGILVGP